MRNTPFVSVVIPSYNDGRYLNESIPSVLGQQFDGSLELLVVSDHTTQDATRRVYESWMRADSRVQVLKNTGDRGIAAASNAGINAAKGDWVAFLDSDDKWLPGALDVRMRAICAYPQAEWLAADYFKWPDGGEPETISFGHSRGVSMLFGEANRTGDVVCLKRPVRHFLDRNIICTGTFMARRELLRRVGGFDNRFFGPQDVHLFLRLARIADLYYIPVPVTLWRIRASSVSHQKWKYFALMQRAVLKVVAADPEFSEYYHLIPKATSIVRENYLFDVYDRMFECRRERRILAAIGYALRAFREAPFSLQSWRRLIASLFP